MTFIVTAACQLAAFQIADTRLTKLDGTLYDDLSVKTVVARCRDVTFSIAYTGIAFVEGRRVDNWIVRKLIQFQSWDKVMLEVTSYLTVQLTEAAQRDSNIGLHGLTLVLSGFGLSSDGVRRPLVGFITNQEAPKPRRNDFVPVPPMGRPFDRYLRTPTFPYYIGIGGAIGREIAINPMRRSLQKQLRRLKSTDNLKAVLDRLVAMLHQHRSGSLAKVIGPYCSAVAVGSSFQLVCVSYGPRGGKLVTPIIVERPQGR